MFLGGVLIYFLAVLPFLIRYKGLFFYYGDYNVQQVPFLIFAHRAVRRGRFFWNPLVDLGGYIPCPDHRIPPDAKYELVAYYCELFHKAF